MEHLIDIPGRLHSVAVEKHVAGTDQIYDDILKTTQDILNLENITDVKVQEGKLQFLNIQGQVLKEISITTEQKQSDWNQTDSTQIDFIKNKPIIYNKQEVDNKLITKQDIIDDIATIRSNAQAGATAYHKPQTGIPATDLASDVQSDLVNIVDIAQVIPEQASESNQLADKNFVNSSVATNTANYISDNGQPFQSLEHLEAYEGILTNNDYAFIVGADSAGNTTYSRYKYKASTHQWALEYILNNSSFTAEQWESISSGITSGLVAKLSAMPTNSELTTILNGKVDTADLNEYTKQVASEISQEQKYTCRHTITETLHQVIYPNNNYRKTEMQSEWIKVVDARGENVKSIRMHFDNDYNPQIETLDDKVVWQNTATQQIPAATSEKNGLMSAEDKGKLNDLPTATELAQELGGKANSADLADVATSGSYNDLSDKPTIQELATVKQIYALDATNPDYPSRIGKYSPFDITSVFGTISIVTHYSDGTEHSLTDTIRAQDFPDAQYTIDNTTYTSYYTNSKNYYLGIRVPFFIANVEQYGNDYTFGVIKFTSTQSGVFKVHSIGIEPSNCTITVNGVVTQSLMSDMVAVQVNAGDVVKVITTTTAADYYVRIIGFVLEGNCGVSVFVNDAGYLTEHQNITGKADKVSNPTNGNFAALDSNGNLIDSGHKHSDYLTQHQSLTNYVQKSQTEGLLKNDGTVDTNQYLIQHQDISGKANKNEMNVVPGTGVDADKTTITLKQGMSATVLTTHQDISGKENAMPIATATGETLTAVVGNYYRLDNVGTLAITLPTIVGATKLQAITFMIACGLSALVRFVPQGSETILYQEGFALENDTIYEVTALWNGSEWTLSRVIYK